MSRRVVAAAGRRCRGARLSWCGGSAPARSSTGSARSTCRSLVLAVVIGLPTTVCCAWRWRLVARGLGLSTRRVPAAVAAYYRSQFLNTDAARRRARRRAPRRAPRPRRPATSVAELRAVVWERVAGQVVQVALTVAVLALLPSPVGRRCPWSLAGAGSGGRAAGGGASSVWVASAWARRRRGPPTSQPGCSPLALAGHRPRLRARRGRPRRHVPGGRADRAARRVLAAAAAGAARAARDGGADEPRRLGSARGHGRVGVRRGRLGASRASPPPSSTA